MALHICRGAKELGTVLGDLSHGEWMIEQRILGREVTIGILDGLPLGVVEVIPEGESMTTSENTPQVPPNTATQRLLIWRWRKKLKNLRNLPFLFVDAGIFARVDFMISEDGNPYFLEVNTLPGLTTTSLYQRVRAVWGTILPSLQKN